MLEMAHRDIRVLKVVLSIFARNVRISTSTPRIRPLVMFDLVEIGSLAQV